MTKQRDAWISEPEAGLILGMSANGVLYQGLVGRLHPRRQGRGRIYRMVEVQQFAAARIAKPEPRGRPSAAQVLARRLQEVAS